MAFPRVSQRGSGNWDRNPGRGIPGLEEGASGGRVLGQDRSQRGTPPLPAPARSSAEPPRHIRRPRGARPARPRYIRAGLLYKAGLVGRGRPGRGQVDRALFPTPPSSGIRGSPAPQGPGGLSGAGVEGSGEKEGGEVGMGKGREKAHGVWDRRGTDGVGQPGAR